MRNVIGIRDLSGHTGSCRAAVVVLGHPPEPGARPEIGRRTDVTLVTDGLPARVYHDAAGLLPAEASALVSRVERATLRAADDVLAGLLACAKRGEAVLALPIDPVEAHELPPVADLVASHSLMHVAETALYRDAWLAAAAEHGLVVHRYQPATVRTELAHLARAGQTEVDEQLLEWGQRVGRPWRREHKEAALGAWLASLVSIRR